MLKPTSSQSNNYLKSEPRLDIIDTDNPRIMAGHAERTGITAPPFRERAVYRLIVHRQELPGLYVYENGEFVATGDWYARQGEG